VKESLFNILGKRYSRRHCLLDLFGGTGSVGIEALSRGAARVRFVDIHRAAIATIKANLEHTKTGSASAEVISQMPMPSFASDPIANRLRLYRSPPV
jgi:16S rRNA (guanine966-N2)-methyltransferase